MITEWTCEQTATTTQECTVTASSTPAVQTDTLFMMGLILLCVAWIPITSAITLMNKKR